MPIHVFSVYDSKAQAFLTPFFERNSLTAARAFAKAANTEGHNFKEHGSDYTLFHIGTWDEETGIIEASNAKTSLGTALEHLEQRAPHALKVMGGE